MPHDTMAHQEWSVPFGQTRAVSRRDAIRSGLATLGLAAASQTATASAPRPSAAAIDARCASPKKYSMKKSINLWAFPYPQRISGLCSFLFWPYPLSSNDPAKRSRGLELAGKIAQAAHHMGVENVLIVPGAVHIPWRNDHEPVRNDVCDTRAREAVGTLAVVAEKLKVSLNIENIFFNGYLMTPMEMNAFVDSFGSDRVRVHFDTGNISMFQNAEHWVPILGKRTKNIHFKEFTKKGTDYSLETFRPLLDGTTNWPAVLEALDAVGYEEFVTFEYFHPYPHYPEALIYQTNDSLNRILGTLVSS